MPHGTGRSMTDLRESWFVRGFENRQETVRELGLRMAVVRRLIGAVADGVIRRVGRSGDVESLRSGQTDDRRKIVTSAAQVG